MNEFWSRNILEKWVVGGFVVVVVGWWVFLRIIGYLH